MKVEVCQRKKRTTRGCYGKKQNKAPEPGTERARMRAVTRESDVMLREKGKKKHKINTEIAKLSQGDWVGRPAMGYFQSQNYTEERLSSTLLCRSQAGSAAATISSTPTPTSEGNGV